MTKRLLAGPETLIDLILHPGWDGDKSHLETRQRVLAKLQELLQSEQVILYVPLELIPIIHLLISGENDQRVASYAVSQILKLGHSTVKIDHERILEQATQAIDGRKGIELYEAVLPFYAKLLRADAVILRSSYSTLTELVQDTAEQLPEIRYKLIKLENLGEFFVNHNFGDSLGNKHIYVSTPQDTLIRLPVGSTVIDFAYQVHTDIGNQCIGAIVNDEKAPLDKQLNNYDVVKIIKAKHAKPCREWLAFAKTRYARKKISRGLKRNWAHQGWKMVKESLGNDIRSYRHKLELVAQLNRCTLDDLMAQVGAGKKNLQDIRDLLESPELQQVSADAVCINPEDLSVLGSGSLNWCFASCCTPLPGDRITGIVTQRTKTVKVHRTHCPNLSLIKPEKLCSPAWNCGFCSVQLLIFMHDKPDTCRPILDCLANGSSQPDLRYVQISQDGMVRASIKLLVKSRKDLDGIVSLIQTMPGVSKLKVTKIAPWIGPNPENEEPLSA